MLLLLAEEYPGTRAEHALLHEVRAVEGDVDSWQRHIAYLEERGHICVESREIAGRTIRQFRLTADGLDLVDGNTAPDPGIELLR